MSDNEEIGELTKQFINKLDMVRQDYIRCKDDLAVSVRKDVVSANIKSFIVDSNGSYDLLVEKLQTYIKSLYDM